MRRPYGFKDDSIHPECLKRHTEFHKPQISCKSLRAGGRHPKFGLPSGTILRGIFGTNNTGDGHDLDAPPK